MGRMEIKWKKWPMMQPGDWHIHQREWDIKPNGEGGQIKCDKGHYIMRPYFKYSTSKWEPGLIDVYEMMLDPIKHNSDVVLLEFGVFYGESMRYYRDFFTHPDAKIVGFDHQPTEFYGEPHGRPYVFPPTHNVFLEQGEQRELEDVKRVCDQYGPFDVIIDDGMHDYPYPTEDVFYQTWPYVKEGGFYFIEDVDSAQTKHLLDEIVIKNEGKGIAFHGGFQGFGPHGGGGGSILVLKKTQNRITGLDDILVEE